MRWSARGAWPDCRAWGCADLKTAALTQMGPFRSTATLNVPAEARAFQQGAPVAEQQASWSHRAQALQGREQKQKGVRRVCRTD